MTSKDVAVLVEVVVAGGGTGPAGVSIWPARTETVSVRVTMDAAHICLKVFTLDTPSKNNRGDLNKRPAP